jgi:hypothetical protein
MASFTVQLNGSEEETVLAVSGSGVRLGAEEVSFEDIYR